MSYDGYEGMIQALAEVRDAWEQFTLEPEQFVDAGDRVVVIHRVRARGRGSGVELMDRSASVYTLRNGRVVRMVVYGEPSEALEAVGYRSSQAQRPADARGRREPAGFPHRRCPFPGVCPTA